MANPRPTRSKPCKIGRKHTGAIGIRLLAAKRKAQRIEHAKTVAAARLHKSAVAAYWRGESSTHPGSFKSKDHAE